MRASGVRWSSWLKWAGTIGLVTVALFGCGKPDGWVYFSTHSVHLFTGAAPSEVQVTIERKVVGALLVSAEGCDGIVDIEDVSDRTPEDDTLRLIRAVAPGRCHLKASGEDTWNETLSDTLEIIVTAGEGGAPDGGDGGAPDGDAPDAGDAGDSGNALCVVPFGKVNTVNNRDLYYVYTDVDTVATPPACPLHTSTDYMGNVVIGYLAGSPGYSIDGRGDYKILSASPATMVGDSAADAFEETVVTFSFTRRIYPDEDAGPGPVWTFVIRVNSDPDPSKWTVSLLSVTKS